MSKRFDIPLRAITKEIPTKLFEIAFKRKFHPKGAKFLDVKLPKLFEREADLVVEYGGEIYHLEIQSVDDPSMPLRMAFYYLLILSNYKKPPHQAVVYVGEKPLKRMENFIEFPTFRFRYEIIDLNRLDCSVFLKSENPHDWVISLLCRMENEKEDIKRIFERIKTLPPKELETVLNYSLHILHLRPKRLNYVLKEVMEEMPITIIDVEKDPLYLRGMEKKAKEDTIKLRKKLNLSPEEIAEILDLPKEKVLKWLKEEGLLKENL